MASLARDWQEAGTGGETTAVPGIWVGDEVMPGELAPSPPTPLPRWGLGGGTTAVRGIESVGDGVISGASVPLTQGLAGGIRGFRGSGKRDRTCRGVAIRWWSC